MKKKNHSTRWWIWETSLSPRGGGALVLIYSRSNSYHQEGGRVLMDTDCDKDTWTRSRVWAYRLRRPAGEDLRVVRAQLFTGAHLASWSASKTLLSIWSPDKEHNKANLNIHPVYIHRSTRYQTCEYFNKWQHSRPPIRGFSDPARPWSGGTWSSWRAAEGQREPSAASQRLRHSPPPAPPLPSPHADFHTLHHHWKRGKYTARWDFERQTIFT